jgi:hypothetical protein
LFRDATDQGALKPGATVGCHNYQIKALFSDEIRDDVVNGHSGLTHDKLRVFRGEVSLDVIVEVVDRFFFDGR